MFRGSVWYVRGPLIRFEGAIPSKATDQLKHIGAMYRDGQWWVKPEKWARVEGLLKQLGVLMREGVPEASELDRRALLDLSGTDELLISGDLPRVLPVHWLGRTTATGYRGLCPWALPEAVRAFQADGIRLDVTPRASRLLQRVETVRDLTRAIQDADPKNLPAGPVLPDGKTRAFLHQRHNLAFANATNARLILADEPGLGKTITMLLLGQILGVERTLIVCQSGIKGNWVEEIQEKTGQSAVEVTGQKGPLSLKSPWTVINHDILPHRVDKLARWNPELVIADECHDYQNPQAKRTQALARLVKQAPHAVLMSGTPMLNYPKGLWPLLDMMYPGWWGKEFDFKVAFSGGHKTKFGWKFDKATRTDILHDWSQSVMIRHLLEDVEDMPMKMRRLVPVDLDRPSRAQYDATAKKLRETLLKARELETKKDYGKAKRLRGRVLAINGEMREIASLGRIDPTVEYAKRTLDAEKPVTVFTVFRSSLAALEQEFRDKGYEVGVVHGDVKDKFAVTKAFQEGKFDVFLGQIKAAGTGINLFRADNTIAHDIDWVPAMMLQLEGRVNRTGQEEKRTRHAYMAGRGTLDEKVIKVLFSKIGAARSVLDTGERFSDEMVAQLMREFFDKDEKEQK